MEKQQRLIDADVLMKNIGKIPQLRGITYSRMKRAVEETPTIDAVPVRHGCWFPYRVAGEPLLRFQCSACHHWVDGGTDRNFCPNCGAKMDGGSNNGTEKERAKNLL